MAFVADSRRSEAATTLAYWNNMLENLEANGLDYRTLPMVIQMNKRDLPDARGEGELGDLRRVIQPPVVPAVAIRGEGVVETLHALLQRCYRSLDRQFGLDSSLADAGAASSSGRSSRTWTCGARGCRRRRRSR